MLRCDQNLGNEVGLIKKHAPDVGSFRASLYNDFPKLTPYFVWSVLVKNKYHKRAQIVLSFFLV